MPQKEQPNDQETISTTETTTEAEPKDDDDTSGQKGTKVRDRGIKDNS